MKHLTLQIRVHWIEHYKLACIIIFWPPQQQRRRHMAREILKWGEENVNVKRGECVPVTFTFMSHQPFIIFFTRLSFKSLFFPSLPEGLPAPGPAPSQLQVETAAHTHTGVCLCFCHRLNPQVWTLLSLYSLFPATVMSRLLWWGGGESWRALTASTLKGEPPFLFSLIQSSSLMKLFNMCSLHFNTHFQFEGDFWWMNSNNKTCTL